MGSLRIRVVTLGCKVNQCESASIVSSIKKIGYNDTSEGLQPSDVYILNTCSVTAEADRKSRQYIGKMRKLNPDCKIIVLGCSSQNSCEKFNKPNVIAIGGTIKKTEFVINVLNKTALSQYNTISDRVLYCDNACKISEKRLYDYDEYPISDKTRAFVKIQDGCDRFCSYCIIPYLRGRSRSRSIDDIVKECELSDSGEMVLTGIDISVYGRDIGTSLKELIIALSKIGGRKRLGSLECEVIDEELLYAMKEGGFCPHFHLSLQSGSDSVLRSMNRHYDTSLFYDKVLMIRNIFPSAGITTDVIVGFPTETVEFFNDSCKFIEKCAFSDIHVFPYSSRTGTLAAKKYTVLSADTVSERVGALLSLKQKLKDRFISENLNSVYDVYVEEDTHDGYNVGYTPNYIKVYSTAPRGTVTRLLLSEPLYDGALGIDLDKN